MTQVTFEYGGVEKSFSEGFDGSASVDILTFASFPATCRDTF